MHFRHCILQQETQQALRGPWLNQTASKASRLAPSKESRLQERASLVPSTHSSNKANSSAASLCSHNLSPAHPGPRNPASGTSSP
jgi:hypothetical protein